MSDRLGSRRRRARRIAIVLGTLYALAAAAILLWPTLVTAGFRSQLNLLGDVVPYGDKLLEVGANVVLFIPAGWIAGTLLPRRKWWLGLCGGVLASATAELAQALLLPGRVPSLRDVLANSLGVALGILLAVALDRRRARDGSADPGPEPGRHRPER